MTQSPTAAAIAEALRELELYADVGDASDVIEFVRALFDQDENTPTLEPARPSPRPDATS